MILVHKASCKKKSSYNFQNLEISISQLTIALEGQPFLRLEFRWFRSFLWIAEGPRTHSRWSWHDFSHSFLSWWFSSRLYWRHAHRAAWWRATSLGMRLTHLQPCNRFSANRFRPGLSSGIYVCWFCVMGWNTIFLVYVEKSIFPWSNSHPSFQPIPSPIAFIWHEPRWGCLLPGTCLPLPWKIITFMWTVRKQLVLFCLQRDSHCLGNRW